MTDWQTGMPPSGVGFEFVTADGRALTGSISFVASYRDASGQRRSRHQMRGGGHGVFEVVRWRRVGT